MRASGTTVTTCLLLLLRVSSVVAAPIEDNDSRLEVRDGPTGDSESDPIPIKVRDINKATLEFDIDCYAMLCLGKSSNGVLQRVDRGWNNDNRKESGVDNGPFSKDGQKKYGTKCPAKDSFSDGEEYTSPEEFQFASSRQGGKGAILGCAVEKGQSSQGAALKNALNKAGIQQATKADKDKKKSWYKIEDFVDDKDKPTDTPYCNAWRKNDKNICKASVSGKPAADLKLWDFDPADYIYTYHADATDDKQKYTKVNKA